MGICKVHVKGWMYNQGCVCLEINHECYQIDGISKDFFRIQGYIQGYDRIIMTKTIWRLSIWYWSNIDMLFIIM
jgi:hypothetical protein